MKKIKLLKSMIYYVYRAPNPFMHNYINECVINKLLTRNILNNIFKIKRKKPILFNFSDIL